MYPALQPALSRIEFTDLSHPQPLHALLQRVKHLREVHQRVLVVVGRSTQFVQDGIRHELRHLAEEQQTCATYEMVRNTIGDVGTAFVMSAGAQNGLIVVQAAPSAAEV
ncbi:hypothetical protein JVU11DRAFT_3643 [Chiua virens]|nr:hypothetical protein JVU11DRAFT_3643 [Chiua virens]